MKRKYIYSCIKAYQAKNYDGTPSGFKEGTKDGDRNVLQRAFKDGRNVRYSNYYCSIPPSCESCLAYVNGA